MQDSLLHMNSAKCPCSPWVLVARWIQHLSGVREVICHTFDSHRGLEIYLCPMPVWHVDHFSQFWSCYFLFVLTGFFLWNCLVLGEWANVAAVNEATSIRLAPSPTVTKNGSSLSNATSHHMTTTPSHNMSSATPHNTTVTPHNTTVTPHNTTATPHNTTVTPHNTTVTPHNTTVTPHNTTVTPHNTTVTPHNTTVTPHNTTVTPHNTTVTPHSTTIMPHNTTIMPHNSTIMPPHNMTITPSSAHTVVPTSSMYPTPTPAPKRGNFSVKDNGIICLFAYMAAKFDIMINSTVCGLKIFCLWAFMLLWLVFNFLLLNK